jgi:hypothetical protein
LYCTVLEYAATMMRRSVGRLAPLVVPQSHVPKQSIRFKSSQSRDERSLLSSATEYYNNLRWRVATSLTESLPKDEQQELLSRLAVRNPHNDEKKTPPDSEEVAKRSIAEAVAAARAEEAKRFSDKWEKERSKLLEETEKAAKKRLENEMIVVQRRLQFERWQQDVERDRQANAAFAADKPAVETTDNAQDTSNISAAQEKEQTSVAGEHPILGSAIVDLGYKRVHIASVHALNTLPVWKKQRTYRHQRAQAMAQDKMKTLNIGLPGIIALHEVRKQIYLFDVLTFDATNPH